MNVRPINAAAPQFGRKANQTEAVEINQLAQKHLGEDAVEVNPNRAYVEKESRFSKLTGIYPKAKLQSLVLGTKIGLEAVRNGEASLHELNTFRSEKSLERWMDRQERQGKLVTGKLDSTTFAREGNDKVTFTYRQNLNGLDIVSKADMVRVDDKTLLSQVHYSVEG